MALTTTDLTSIRTIIQEELANVSLSPNQDLLNFLSAFNTNGYPIIPLSTFGNLDNYLTDYSASGYPMTTLSFDVGGLDGFISDYNTNGYPIIPIDGFTKVDAFLNDYAINGYPTSSIGGGTIDLTPVQTVVDQIALDATALKNDTAIIKGYTDTVETSLTAIKAKTDTITAISLSPLQVVVDAIKLKTDTITPTDLSPLTTISNLINGKITTVQNSLDTNLDSKLSTLYPQISALLSNPTALNGFDYFDLNGNFGSFPNTHDVYLYPNNHPYKVEKSYLFQNDTNQFLIMYILIDFLGKKMVAPHSYLIDTLPVADVVSNNSALLESKIVSAQTVLLTHLDSLSNYEAINQVTPISYDVYFMEYSSKKAYYESVLADLISQRV